MNDHGAGLAIAGRLAASREGVELYELRFEDDASHAGARAAHAHGGGTLAVTEDSDSGAAEHERCGAAATLLCFRAANVALYFDDGLDPADVAKLEGAIRALGEEGS